jgi:mRNA interferase MazF
MSNVRTGEVWWADLRPTVGHEQGGRRPALVVGSPLHCSLPISMALVAPCTTVDRGLPHHVALDWEEVGLAQPTFVRTEDVRAISTRRLVGARPIGSLSPRKMAAVRTYLRLMLDL